MHEMALMNEILKIIHNDVSTRNLSKVNKIELIVGDFSNVMPEALEMAFDIYKSHGISFLDKDCTLAIIREVAEAKCTICDCVYKAEHQLALCPTCLVPSGLLICGETFRVHSYEGC